ncbi:MAG: hypothetical protein AAFW89_14080, partial [Bacteroidota bacterium]
IQNITEIFALYLRNYQNVRLVYEGTLIDPSSLIESESSFVLSDITDEDKKNHPVVLEIIEWKNNTDKKLFLCSDTGFPYSGLLKTRFHVGDFSFSAYLKTTFIKDLYQNSLLDLGEFKPELVQVIDEAKVKIKEYFLARTAEKAKSVVDKWKEDDIYP